MGLTLFAILKVSWNSSVLTNWRVNEGSVEVCVQEMFAGELLCQPTGIWRRRAWAQGTRARAAMQLDVPGNHQSQNHAMDELHSGAEELT